MFYTLSGKGTSDRRGLYNANGTPSDKNPPKCSICDKNEDDGVKLSKQEENELFSTATAAKAYGNSWSGTYRIGKSGRNGGDSDDGQSDDGQSDGGYSVGESEGVYMPGSMPRRGSVNRRGSGTKSDGDCVCMRCTIENNSNPNRKVPNGKGPSLVGSNGGDPHGLKMMMMGGRSSLRGLYAPPEVEKTYTPMLPGAGKGGQATGDPLNRYPNPFAHSNGGGRDPHSGNGGGRGPNSGNGPGRSLYSGDRGNNGQYPIHGPGRSLYSGDRSLYSSDDGRGLAYRQGYGHKEGELDGSFRSWNNGSKHF